VYEYFLGKGASESDVLLLAGRVERDLAELGIEIFEGQPYEPEYMVSEAKLEERISAHLTYANPNALIRDIRSILAVIQLRGDARPRFLETCGALFVTTNRPLVAAVLEFTHTDLPDESVTLAINDIELTNIAWLKQPSVAPELPRRRLIATCYAALQPSDEFRRRYLQEVDRLATSGRHSEQDVYLLRHSLEARRFAMDLTVGDEDAFTLGTISEVLEVMHLEIEREARAKADHERARADAAGSRVEALQHEIAAEQQVALERRARREQRATRLARMLAWAVAIVTSVGLARILYLTLPALSPETQPTWVRVAASGVVAALTLATWMTSRFTVASFKERLEAAVTPHIVSLFAWMAGE
jgi:hypothetical protein